MAYTKAQLEALKNSLLAGGQPITASIHREFVQKIIDELYDAQSRGNLLSGVQADTTNVSGDLSLVIRSGQAYLIPTSSLTAAGLNFDDINGLLIIDPQNGDLLAYNAVTDEWENVPDVKVPYTGAVANVNLGEFGLATGFIKLDTSPTDTPTDQAVMKWDASRETVSIILNGFTTRVNQDSLVYVKNSTGTAIPKGVNVGFAGTDGASGHILVKKFLANGTEPSYYYIGVTTEEIANGGFGQIMSFGELAGINTLSYSPTPLLYCSTTVAGAFQTTPPTAPNNIILVAAAINFKNNGDIRIRPTLGSNINQDEGIKITSPTNGQALVYNSTTLLWENQTVAAGITGTLTANRLPKATGASTLADSRIIDNGTNVLVDKTTDSGQKFQVNGSGLFLNSLEIAGASPVLRVRTDASIANIAYIKDSFEEAVSLKFNDSTNEFAITTNLENYPIRIEPHGTGNIKLPNVPTGTGDTLGRDSLNNLVRLALNPRVFAFNFGGSAGNPNVTAGGTFNIFYSAGNFGFTSMDIGDVATMKIEGKIQTRNAANLISNISLGTSTGAIFLISSLGWNWSNAGVGGFTGVVTCTRIGTSTYRYMVDFYVLIYDGTVTEVKQLRTESTSASGIIGGGVNGSFSVTFAEANAANQLFLYSGVIQIYKPTQ